MPGQGKIGFAMFYVSTGGGLRHAIVREARTGDRARAGQQCLHWDRPLICIVCDEERF
jgi:hypothetical protein